MKRRGFCQLAASAIALGTFDARADPALPQHPPVPREQDPASIVADTPYWQLVVRRLDELHVRTVRAFNTEFERYLPEARGHILIVAMLSDRLVLPAAYWPSETGVTLDLLRQRIRETSRGIFMRDRRDGTRVYVLYGNDHAALTEMIASL